MSEQLNKIETIYIKGYSIVKIRVRFPTFITLIHLEQHPALEGPLPHKCPSFSE